MAWATARRTPWMRASAAWLGWFAAAWALAARPRSGPPRIRRTGTLLEIADNSSLRQGSTLSSWSSNIISNPPTLYYKRLPPELFRFYLAFGVLRFVEFIEATFRKALRCYTKCDWYDKRFHLTWCARPGGKKATKLNTLKTKQHNISVGGENLISSDHKNNLKLSKHKKAEKNKLTIVSQPSATNENLSDHSESSPSKIWIKKIAKLINSKKKFRIFHFNYTVKLNWLKTYRYKCQIFHKLKA